MTRPEGSDLVQPSPSSVAVALSGVSKRFGAIQALHDVDFKVGRGRVHALVGENGAGKSTLVGILAGLVQPDEGHISIGGSRVSLQSPAASRAHGIAVIHQELALFPHQSVADNILMGRQPRSRYGRLDRSRMHREAEEALRELGADLDVGATVSELSVAAQQVVEIAKALSQDAGVLVMDEPTAALNTKEADRLGDLVLQLRARGVAIIYVTHRLAEVDRLADDITVLRDGSVVTSGPASELDGDKIIQAMVGRSVDTLFHRSKPDLGSERLVVQGLTRDGEFDDISFSVRSGEVVGLAGLVGAGRSEVARAIFGLTRVDAGTVTIEGQKLPPGRPDLAVRAGVAYVPEDRRVQGLIMPFGVGPNISLSSLGKVSRHLVLSRTAEAALATPFAEMLAIKASSLRQLVSTLSGGNQQKVVLSRWLATEPRVLILDEPTRGIDVGSKSEIYALIDRLARGGLAVVLISSELPEVLGLSDRVFVLARGRIAAEFERGDATPEAVMLAATGKAEAA